MTAVTFVLVDSVRFYKVKTGMRSEQLVCVNEMCIMRESRSDVLHRTTTSSSTSRCNMENEYSVVSIYSALTRSTYTETYVL